MEFINANMQVIVAAIVVLVVLLIVLLVWRAISPSVMGRRGQRLGISEYHELDKTRRLVLVRRDNVEHLLLIGGAQDLVVESGITVPGQAAAYVTGHDEERVPPAVTSRPAPRPAVFGDRRPPPLRTVEPNEPSLTSNDKHRDQDPS